MNNIIAEQAKEKYSFRLTQSAKGNWYVERIEVNGDDRENLVAEMKDLATKATALLDEINKTGV